MTGPPGKANIVQHAPFLKDVLVFLVAAGLVVPLFHRARVGAVLGFLLIGVAVGPYGFGQLAAEHAWVRYLTIEDRARAEPFAELGVIFLLFLIGIEMSVGRLWSLRRFVAGIGGLQFVLSAIVIGAGLSFMGTDRNAAVVLGLGLAMSSTAVVMQLLEEQGRTATPIGRVAIAVLLFQDLMVAPVLFGAEILARGGSVVVGLSSALLQAALAVAAILIAGRFVLRPLFRIAVQTGSRELIMAMTLLMVVGAAAATGYAGLSTALGAFLAGVLLSETEYRHQVEIDIAPFKGLLVGLFFITVGMTIDMRAVWQSIDVVMAAVAILLATKAVILFMAGRVFGVTLPVAVEASILLAQAGEFGFVVITLGHSAGLVSLELAQLSTAVVGISMMITPFLAFAARWIAARFQRIEHRDHMPASAETRPTDHVIIGGYGRVGRTIAHLLHAENVPFVALDTNGELVSEERKAGRAVYFGDASRAEFLHHAGIENARAIVVTVNNARAADRMVAAARRENPDVPVFARAKDPMHAVRLLELGAVAVIPETVEASLQLGARMLESLGIPEEAVESRLDELRRQELGRLWPRPAASTEG
jgi:CPA2 family monovalent cation:H+ antiporter-2